MAQRAETFDLGSLRLSSGEAAFREVNVSIEPLEFASQTYEVEHGAAEVRLDVSRTTGRGNAMRLRYEARLHGPCMRCLEDAGAAVHIDAREVDQPGAGDEDLASPYLEEQELDLRAWARDALVLALPTQIVCGEECRGLCAICGANLNADPGHDHEKAPDRRWAALGDLRFD